MTALQSGVNLRMTRTTPGQQTTGGNARTTRSFSWQGADATNLFGKFVARGDQPWKVRPLTATDTAVHALAGIVGDDKLQQNAAGTNGGVTITQDSDVLVMSYGGITLQHDGDIGMTDEIYLILEDTNDADNVGKITNQAAAAGQTTVQIGGPSFVGKPLVQIYETAEGGSTQAIEVQINLI